MTVSVIILKGVTAWNEYLYPYYILQKPSKYTLVLLIRQFFGGAEPVAPHERDPLIALLDSGPDEVTLVAQLSRRFAPPTETGTEGDVATGPIAPIHQR